MLILRSTGSGRAGRLALLFGVGQIGSYVLQGLLSRGFQVLRNQPFSWTSPVLQAEHSGQVRDAVVSAAEGVQAVSVIWSAGTCGFHSTEDDVAEELASFGTVLQLFRELREALPGLEADFHLVSSAGGLFEGQRVIGASSQTTPRRPYGRLKQQQETLARQQVGTGRLLIYRPSSVYGPMEQDAHRGLINNLVKNARNGRFTVLDAQVMSLRDYVYAGDIGQYIARQVCEGGAGSGNDVRFLVSGRCSPIFEVVRKIQRLLHTNVYYRLDAGFGNHGHITFNPDVMPADWRPVTLDYGIRQFALVD